jgi:hypothetical protein
VIFIVLFRIVTKKATEIAFDGFNDASLFGTQNPQNYMKRKAMRSLPLAGSAYSAISA